ncbi:TPA: GntR family transcriptional regulator, partial [Enterococcus faecalis]|nr:GntR family transcriptional regulator [Enterococcus faecalis]
MLPKYEIIKRDIIEKIESGEFSTGEKVYSEGDLKRKYNVSNTTVVKALNDLVNEGY